MRPGECGQIDLIAVVVRGLTLGQHPRPQNVPAQQLALPGGEETREARIREDLEGALVIEIAAQR